MSSDDPKPLVHFGYQNIPTEEKTPRVQAVFSSVAQKYDLMNDLMSLGLHRCWKRILLSLSHVRAGQRFLDLASGTGDIARLLAHRVGPTGLVVSSDLNAPMLKVGRDRNYDLGLLKPLHYVQTNAECLPFPANEFDGITIAFGLRNVTHPERALSEMYRVLKPGGQLLILEFSHPHHPWIHKFYDLYSFHWIPKLGQWITGDRDSYQYLVESIRRHPNQEELKKKILQAGFDDCHVHNMLSGVVALHRAFKY